jgi:IS5 family transposase
MFRYTNSSQISLDDFMDNLGKKLNPKNRWVRLAHQIPWDDLAKIYSEALCTNMGRPSKDARLVIGAIIIKHKKGLPDEEVIPEVQENPYLQYFVGLQEFTYKPIFDPSLFVALRKRLGTEAFEQFSQKFIDQVKSVEQLKKKKPGKGKNQKSENSQSSEIEKDSSNQGQLLLDAVVAPQDIKFPTDLDLLNGAREHTEALIDQLWQPEKGKRKPRTHRRIARKSYLKTAMKRRKSKKDLRKSIRKQLGYLSRNIKIINQLLEEEKPSLSHPFSKNDLKKFWVIQKVYRQQKQMYDMKSHTVPDRIVSISQPHVRPIVRGKAGKDVEFGAKLSVSLVEGFAYLDHLSWDAFNESVDLISQVENYKKRFGFYPESVHADKIFGTQANRHYLKERDIHFSGKPLGRPPKLSKEEKRELKKGLAIRNRIEGKFGEGKRKYDLNLVKAKTSKTSESWIACVFFVMNLAHWLRVDFFVSTFWTVCKNPMTLIHYFKERFDIAIVY